MLETLIYSAIAVKVLILIVRHAMPIPAPTGRFLIATSRAAAIARRSERRRKLHRLLDLIDTLIGG